jgi:hypothetical protein
VYSYETEPDAPLVPRVIEAWCAEVTITVYFYQVLFETISGFWAFIQTTLVL